MEAKAKGCDCHSCRNRAKHEAEEAKAEQALLKEVQTGIAQLEAYLILVQVTPDRRDEA